MSVVSAEALLFMKRAKVDSAENIFGGVQRCVYKVVVVCALFNKSKATAVHQARHTNTVTYKLRHNLNLFLNHVLPSTGECLRWAAGEWRVKASGRRHAAPLGLNHWRWVSGM